MIIHWPKNSWRQLGLRIFQWALGLRSLRSMEFHQQFLFSTEKTNGLGYTKKIGTLHITGWYVFWIENYTMLHREPLWGGHFGPGMSDNDYMSGTALTADVEISQKRARRKTVGKGRPSTVGTYSSHVSKLDTTNLKKTSVIWAILFWDTVSRQVSKCPPLLIPTIDSGMSLFRVKI